MDANLESAVPTGTVGNENLGLLMYDVPMAYQKLANLMRERLRKAGLRVNLSCVLFRWADRALVEGIVAEVQEETGQFCKAVLIEQAECARPTLIHMANESAVQQVMALHKSLIARIEAAPKLVEKAIVEERLLADDQPKDYARRVGAILREVWSHLSDLEAMAYALALEHGDGSSLKGWFSTVKGLLEEETRALAAVKAVANRTVENVA